MKKHTSWPIKLALLGAILYAPNVLATIYELSPVTSNSPACPDFKVCNHQNLTNAINQLKPGDQLHLRQGVFEMSNSLHIVGCQDLGLIEDCAPDRFIVRGTEDAPIIIRSAPGEKATIKYSGEQNPPLYTNNVISIFRTAFLRILGLEITHGEIDTEAERRVDGVKIYDSYKVDIGGPGEDEGNKIHSVGVGISMHSDPNLPFTGVNEGHNIINNNISNTHGFGEGMYLGDSKFLADGTPNTYVIDACVRDNFVHDTGINDPNSQGDGIEIKVPGRRNTIANNILMNTKDAAITMYGYYDSLCQTVVGDERNKVIANLIINAHTGMFIAGAAKVLNNIVVGSFLNGLYLTQASGCLTNVEVVNNTVIDSGGHNADLRNWQNGQNMRFSNNALLMVGLHHSHPGFFNSGLSVLIGISGPLELTLNNTHFTQNVGWSFEENPVPNFLVSGNGPQDYQDIAGFDLTPTPGSALLDAGDPTYAPALDFLGRPRDTTPDVGAIEYIKPGGAPPLGGTSYACGPTEALSTTSPDNDNNGGSGNNDNSANDNDPTDTTGAPLTDAVVSVIESGGNQITSSSTGGCVLSMDTSHKRSAEATTAIFMLLVTLTFLLRINLSARFAGRKPR